MTITNILIFIAILAGSTYADYLLKKASLSPGIFQNYFFVVGVFLYLIQAFFWTLMYKKIDFSLMSIYYSLGLIILSLIIGVFIFNENLTPTRIIGLVLGLISFYILSI